MARTGSYYIAQSGPTGHPAPPLPMTGSPFSEPISALTPELLDRLKEQVETTLVHLIKTNRRTRYARESPLLNEFRAALDALDDANAVVQDEALLESFRMTVPLSAYDAYEPFINQLVAPNPREKDVKDMFSPGLPYFIASSSATSGKTAKLFAKYRHATGSLEDVDAHANPTSDHGGKNCLVYSLAYTDLIKVLDDENAMVAQFPVTYMSAGVIRMRNRIDVEKDPWFITLTGMFHLYSTSLSRKHRCLWRSAPSYIPCCCQLHSQLQILPFDACPVRAGGSPA